MIKLLQLYLQLSFSENNNLFKYLHVFLGHIANAYIQTRFRQLTPEAKPVCMDGLACVCDDTTALYTIMFS